MLKLKKTHNKKFKSDSGTRHFFCKNRKKTAVFRSTLAWRYAFKRKKTACFRNLLQIENFLFSG